jgi:hypothetical protein
MGLHTLNITMAYREDIVMMFKQLTAITQEFYNACTQYLLEKGLIVRSPYVSMPKSVEFVQDKNYLAGINPLAKKRTLNTVEVAPEVKKHFSKGAELAKSIIKELSEILLHDDIQTPMTAGGNITRSTAAPFSDKLMMYCTGLFCSFSLGSNAFGTAFSLRHDLPAKVSVFMKDIFEYAHEGATLMIRNGWMEEPPQMVDRKELIKA